MRLADLARREIVTWHKQRMTVKMNQLNHKLASFHDRLDHTTGKRQSMGSSDASDVDSLISDETMDDTASVFAQTHDSTLDVTAARVFELGVTTIAKTLDLPLVYVLKLSNTRRVSQFQSSLISSYGMPDPPPAFDEELHLRALRNPEGGLLYQNENMTTHYLDVSGRSPPSDSVQYSSAILVRVLETPLAGFVVAAFANNGHSPCVGFAENSRQSLIVGWYSFGMEDLDFIRRVAAELKLFCESKEPRDPADSIQTTIEPTEQSSQVRQDVYE